MAAANLVKYAMNCNIIICQGQVAIDPIDHKQLTYKDDGRLVNIREINQNLGSLGTVTYGRVG